MTQTKAGAAKAAATSKAKYGEDYYKNIGSIGGKLGTTGGFYANPELASRAGKIGGHASRRKAKDYTEFFAPLAIDLPLIEPRPSFLKWLKGAFHV